MVGIVSYGYYIPPHRITVEEIAKAWGKNPEEVSASLRITEKAVASIDEDSLTMGFESASMALAKSSVPKKDIKSVLFGSETPPYSVNPTSTILAEFLGIPHNYLSYDMQFACKAGTGGMITTAALVRSGFTKYGLVCASDKANAKTHDALEYTAGSGSVSVLMGNENVAVEIVDVESFSSDTPDFWRREGIRYPSHGGRFTGKPSYFYHIQQMSELLLKKTKRKPEDFAYAVFHMPNGKFPLEIAKTLGFTKEQVAQSLVISQLGNSYTASALMGLVSVLEFAKPGQLIYLASYGSGAGSDGFVLRVTKHIDDVRQEFQKQIEKKEYVSYPTYLKFMGHI